MEPDTLSRGGETAAGLQSKDNRGEKGEWGKKGGKERAKRTTREERERVEREKGKRGKEGARRRRRRAKAKVSEKREIKGGEEGAGSGVARKASVWRAWRATTELARWSNRGIGIKRG